MYLVHTTSDVTYSGLLRSGFQEACNDTPHALQWHWNLENLIRAGSNLDPSAEDGCLFISFHMYFPTHHISHAYDINDSPVWQPLEHLQQGLGLLLQQLLVFLQALLRPSGGPTLDHLSQPCYVLFFFMLFQVILSVWILWKLKLTNWVKSTSKLRPTSTSTKLYRVITHKQLQNYWQDQ